MATKQNNFKPKSSISLSLASLSLPFLFSCFQDMSEGHYILPTFTRKEVEDDTVEDTVEDGVRLTKSFYFN